MLRMNNLKKGVVMKKLYCMIGLILITGKTFSNPIAISDRWVPIIKSKSNAGLYYDKMTKAGWVVWVKGVDEKGKELANIKYQFDCDNRFLAILQTIKDGETTYDAQGALNYFEPGPETTDELVLMYMCSPKYKQEELSRSW